jgi:hypothetical protein
MVEDPLAAFQPKRPTAGDAQRGGFQSVLLRLTTPQPTPPAHQRRVYALAKGHCMRIWLIDSATWSQKGQTVGPGSPRCARRSPVQHLFLKASQRNNFSLSEKGSALGSKPYGHFAISACQSALHSTVGKSGRSRYLQRKDATWQGKAGRTASSATLSHLTEAIALFAMLVTSPVAAPKQRSNSRAADSSVSTGLMNIATCLHRLKAGV